MLCELRTHPSTALGKPPWLKLRTLSLPALSPETGKCQERSTSRSSGAVQPGDCSTTFLPDFPFRQCLAVLLRVARREMGFSRNSMLLQATPVVTQSNESSLVLNRQLSTINFTKYLLLICYYGPIQLSLWGSSYLLLHHCPGGPQPSFPIIVCPIQEYRKVCKQEKTVDSYSAAYRGSTNRCPCLFAYWLLLDQFTSNKSVLVFAVSS